MPVFDDLVNIAAPEAAVGTRKLQWDQPDTVGKRNALRRARRQLDLQWSPLRKIAQNTLNGLFCIPDQPPAPGEVRIGAPYSSAGRARRFIGSSNAPLNGFFYAVNNPFSDFYLRYLQDHSEPYFNCAKRYSLLFYGTVCSTFCDYALNLPHIYFTREWDNAPELYRIEKQDVQALQLCDTVVTVNKSGYIGGHVRMVTGIGRDETGKICEIEISEGTEPHAVTIHHTASQLAAQLVSGGGNYYIYRCKTVDQTEDPPEPPLPACPDVLMSMIPGSLLGSDDPVCFAMTSPEGTLVVESAEHSFTAEVAGLPTEIFDGKTYYLWKHEPLPSGEYRVFLRKNGTDGIPGSFSVITSPKLQPKKNGEVLPLHPWRICTEDGTLVTPHSDCLYESGALKPLVELFVTDGKLILKQKIGLRMDGAAIRAYPASAFLDADGNPCRYFLLNSDTVLYTYAAEDGDAVTLEFSAPGFCSGALYLWGNDRRDWLTRGNAGDRAIFSGTVTIRPSKKNPNIPLLSIHLYHGQRFLPVEAVPVYCRKPDDTAR